ncbi:MAG: hypothetical protein RL711_458 [Bacteroidota bacterium]|jgi:lysophospholipase L1-like esterase
MQVNSFFVGLVFIAFSLVGCKKSTDTPSKKNQASIKAEHRLCAVSDNIYNPSYTFTRFEEMVKTYETNEKARIDQLQNKILFYGSSTMYFWNPYLANHFAPLPVIGHGFGGATYPEMLYYAPRLLFPYKPSIVVIYSENDQFNEPAKSVNQVKDDVCELFSRIHAALPEAKIICLAMKHSPGRDFKWKAMNEANLKIKQLCESTDFITYKDFNSTLKDSKGNIDSSLFEKDYIHMNAKGYQKWANALKPYLENMYASL